MSDPTPFTLSDGITHRPTAGTWARHTILLLVTFLTMTMAGVLFPFGRIATLPDADPQSFSDAVQMIGSVPVKYFGLIAFALNQLITDPTYLKEGLSFSLSLMFILLSHEMGHYIACRLYR